MEGITDSKGLPFYLGAKLIFGNYEKTGHCLSAKAPGH